MAINTVNRYLNDLDTSTTEQEIDKIMDARDIITPTWDLLYDKKETKAGGEFLTQSLEYERSPGGFINPYSTMRTEHKEQYTKSIYEWCIAYTSAGIPQRDLYLNSGSSQVFDLALQKRASAKKSLINLMSYNQFAIHAGDTIQSLSSPETLTSSNQVALGDYLGGTYDMYGDRMKGLPYAIDDTETYGRIATSGNPWWTSQIIDSDSETPASKFTLALNQKMLSLVNRGATSVSYCPMGRQYWDRFQALIGPQQDLNDPKLAELGYESIKKSGCVYYLDPYAPNTGTDDILYYFTPSRFKFMVHSKVDFKWTGWMDGLPNGQWAVVGFYLMLGNFVSNNRMNLGKIVNLNE